MREKEKMIQIQQEELLIKRRKERKKRTSPFETKNFCKHCGRYYPKSRYNECGIHKYKYCIVCNSKLRCNPRKRPSNVWSKKVDEKHYY
jgi:hypothetical protein